MEEMHENRVREYFAYRLLLPLPLHTIRDFLRTGKKKRAVPVIGDQPFLLVAVVAKSATTESSTGFIIGWVLRKCP